MKPIKNRTKYVVIDGVKCTEYQSRIFRKINSGEKVAYIKSSDSWNFVSSGERIYWKDFYRVLELFKIDINLIKN